jgi:hypothetical protein
MNFRRMDGKLSRSSPPLLRPGNESRHQCSCHAPSWTSPACDGPGDRVRPPAAALMSPTLEIQRFEGVWRGEFQNGLTGRIGTIDFALNPDNGMLYGDMALTGSAMPKRCGNPVQASVKGKATDRLVLTVEDGRAAHRDSNSHVEWSSDPEQRCLVDTWFEGVFHADTLGGRYFSRLSGGDTLLMGEWWAVRRLLDGQYRRHDPPVRTDPPGAS